jgi:N-dimethylarginine dimethylaminohydrolase
VEVRLCRPTPGCPTRFTRDTSLMTPWGLLGLRPGARTGREVDVALEAARAAGVPVLGRIEHGRIEGRRRRHPAPGVVLIGISGERTDEAAPMRWAASSGARGWKVLTYRFDPHFLHLDTLLCLADRNLAMACTDVLEDRCWQRWELGIDLMPVTTRKRGGWAATCWRLATARGDGRHLLAARCRAGGARLPLDRGGPQRVHLVRGRRPLPDHAAAARRRLTPWRGLRGRS